MHWPLGPAQRKQDAIEITETLLSSSQVLVAVGGHTNTKDLLP